MEAQGYKPKIILAKDNESEIHMLINGKDSCTSNSQHVAIKYLWSTDRIKAEKMNLKYCPTDKTINDFMPKPQQGTMFQIFRNIIMGWEHISTLYNYLSSNEEHVANNNNLVS